MADTFLEQYGKSNLDFPAVQRVSLDVTQFVQPFLKYVPSIFRSKYLKDIAVHLICVFSANFWVIFEMNHSLYQHPRCSIETVFSQNKWQTSYF